MDKQEILAKAQEMANQHIKDIEEARQNLVKDMLDKGYNPDEWTICDNLLDIQSGKEYTYSCWALNKNPNKL